MPDFYKLECIFGRVAQVRPCTAYLCFRSVWLLGRTSLSCLRHIGFYIPYSFVRSLKKTAETLQMLRTQNPMVCRARMDLKDYYSPDL